MYLNLSVPLTAAPRSGGGGRPGQPRPRAGRWSRPAGGNTWRNTQYANLYTYKH